MSILKLYRIENYVFAFDVSGELIGYWPTGHSQKPTKRNKFAMLNCYRYRIEWVN